MPSFQASGFIALAELVSAHTGTALGPAVRDRIERAARRSMQALAIDRVEELTFRLASDAESFEELIDEISVGETYFFRDKAHFDLVRSTVLPAFMVSGAQNFRVWSAGCSSGEEAYSLAMLLSDLGLLERAFVLATDISQRALRVARAGVYRDWSLRGFAPHSVPAHLRKDERGYAVSDRIKAAVQFAALNLAADCYPSPNNDTIGMNLIFCRNVLMYMEPNAIAAVERRLYAALAPGGYLFLGPSDPILGSHAPFEVKITTPGGLCYLRPAAGERATLPSLHGQSSLPVLSLPVESRVPRAAAPEPAADAGRSTAAAAAATSAEILAEARAAAQRADYARVIELSTCARPSAELCAMHVRALWNLVGASAAEALCASAVKQHELAAELRYLHALVLLELGRDRDAARALRDTLYLDRSLTIAYFTLGSVCARSGELAAARVAYRNAETRCRALAIDDELALGDGIRAGGLGLAAARALAALGNA